MENSGKIKEDEVCEGKNNSDELQSCIKSEDKLDIGEIPLGMDTGWAWVILFASFGSWTFVTMLYYTSGIVYKAIIHLYDRGVLMSSFPGTILTAIGSFAAPLASVVIDRYSCRVAIFLGGLLSTIGTFLTAFAPNTELVILFLGGIAGLGSALTFTACAVVINYNFKRRRNLAFGFCSTGSGISLFVFAPLLQLSRDYYGSMGMFMILSAICAQMMVFGMLCFPSKMELQCQRLRKREARVCKLRGDSKKMSVFKLYLKVLFDRHVLGLSFSVCGYYLFLYTLALHLPTFVVTKGLSDIDAAFIMSLIGLTTVAGRFLTGVFANMNCVDDGVLYSGSIAIVSIVTCIYVFISEYPFSHYAFAVIYGLFNGSSNTLILSVTSKFIVAEFVCAALGIQYFFGGFGTLFGPSLSGYILDAGGTYEHTLLLCGGSGAFAAVLSFVTIYCCKNKTLPEDKLKTSEI